MKNVAIIGGGASGLVSAIFSKTSGCNTVIFEKNARVGKKILQTGNGRCNLSNENISEEFYHGGETEFIKTALSDFPKEKTLEFFKNIGLLTISDGGRIYPISLSATSVLDVLRFKCEDLGVIIKTDCTVKTLTKNGNGFLVNGEYFDAVIVCTGGKASPSSGSDGEFFDAVKNFHTITKIKPSLVSLKTKGRVKELKGQRVRCMASLFSDDVLIKKDYGEVLFTDYGLSGIVIMGLSRDAKCGDIIELDLLPKMSEKEAEFLLKTRKEEFKNRETKDFLSGIFTNRVSMALLKDSNVTSKKIGDTDIENLKKTIKKWRFEVVDKMSFKEAQVSAGGVKLSEVNPHTMESKIVRNLFFAGEILDVDGDCGGYNLQWAWTSGALAGMGVGACSK